MQYICKAYKVQNVLKLQSIYFLFFHFRRRKAREKKKNTFTFDLIWFNRKRRIDVGQLHSSSQVNIFQAHIDMHGGLSGWKARCPEVQIVHTKLLRTDE